ncbi:MAG: hypothetical protein OXG92_08715 [Chloroflexi bacterium]|nr:hypothetical protein [Chloroflexota bacterium]MCY3582010.1 hypothetical protein [Chloroflexota bacterium]MCY3716531.1 hypothetical protein [Chloroflexota bacterium]MDE2651640.1 hypothetical protein [Chloroflexota bacterium]MXV92700.1 hypothetical protein [Chloroflexota bacterium]
MAEPADLQAMRYEALLKIMRTMGGVALSGAVPTPTLELAKQLGISITDAWMCFDIYRTYFGKDLKKQELAHMLQTTGLIFLGGGIAGYAGIRLAQVLLRDLLETIPIANAIITGIAFGSSTLLLGLAWLALVEQSYFAGAGEAS